MKKRLLIIVSICIAMCLCAIPTSARDVERGGTITIGEEHLNLKFLDGSETKVLGWYNIKGDITRFPPAKTINFENSYTDASFPASEFGSNVGNWFFIDPSTGNVVKNLTHGFVLVAPPPTPTTPPTPAPTPSEGNLVISSSPSDATVYVDNAIKGITPLTVNVANGEHVVRMRLDGYQESKTSVTVNGADVSIKPVLIPVVTTVATTAPTTVATTIPTTVPTTIQTTVPTEVPTTIHTTVETTVPITTEPTVESLMVVEQKSVSNDDTLASMQSQIDAQATKNAEQDVVIAEQTEQIGLLQQLIDSILGFLGLK